MSKNLQSLVPVVLLIVLTGCSSVVGASTRNQASAGFPTGRFQGVKHRLVTLLFNTDGTFEYYYAGGAPQFTGTYTVKGDQITSEVPAEEGSDPKCNGPITHQWSFDGEALTFALNNEDPCDLRREEMNDTFVRVK